jgi:hypothetical protein
MSKEQKPTIKQIIEILKSCKQALNKVEDYISQNSLESLEFNETFLTESIGRFKNISLYLEGNIAEGNLDSLTFSTRNEILKTLLNLNQQFINFISNTGYLQAISTSVDLLYILVLERGLDKKDRVRYDQKFEKLNLKEVQLNKQLEKVNILLERLKEAEDNYFLINSYYHKVVDTIKPSIEINIGDIESERQKVLTITESLEKFNTKVESSILDYEKYFEKFKTFEEQYIILSKEFEALIPKAVGYTLSDIYSIKENEKKNRGYWWLWCLGSLVGVLLISGIIFTKMSLDDIKNMNPIPIIVRFTSLSPIISAIIFSSFQYLKEKRLQEEYGFKSTVALTLDLFKRIITQETDLVSKGILEKSINQIYTSPRELYFKFPNKDDHHNSFEKLEKLINQKNSTD